MEDGYFVNDQELAVNDSLHLELSEDEVDSTLPPPGVTDETLIIDETILLRSGRILMMKKILVMSLMRK